MDSTNLFAMQLAVDVAGNDTDQRCADKQKTLFCDQGVKQKDCELETFTTMATNYDSSQHITYDDTLKEVKVTAFTPFTASTGKFPPTSRISPSILQLYNNLTSLLNDTQQRQQQQQQQQHTHRPTPNLTQAEKRALKQLKFDNSVILKPATKVANLCFNTATTTNSKPLDN